MLIRLKNNLTLFILILLFFNLIKPAGVVYADGSLSLTVIGTTYSQNFDTLVSVGTGTSVSPPFPLGWHFSEAGTNANTTYTAGTGSSSTGDTYSFGSAASTERAFGGLLSGTLNPTIGANFVNNTGATISSLVIAYTGEQWRLGTAGRSDRLDFQISFNATSLTTGIWADVDALDFTTPNTVGSTGAKDGNLPAYRTSINYTISGINILNGDAFWIRWLDFNASGADDGLAVDDFSITILSAPIVTSINRASPDPTNASSVDFSVIFSNSVTGVDISDFALNTTGISGASVTDVIGSGTTYTVSVNTGSGSGTLRLDLVDDDSIINSSLIPLGGTGAGNGNFTTGEVYTIDKTAPVVSSILRAGANPTNVSSVNYTVTFSKTVTGVDVADFSLTTTGISGASVSSVSGSGATYNVVVNTGTGSGTLRLNVADDDSIIDSVSNPLGGVGPGNGDFASGETYTIDRTPSPTTAGLIVNEVSNGASGNKEWVEFVVVGSTPTVNLSGWIIDDNNGDFDSFAIGKGIATGHLRFADPMPACPTGHSLAAVPVGSRIVVYNSDDVEGPLAAYPNDPCDSDADGVYYLPVGANPNNTNALQQCTDRPNVSPALVNPNYSGCAYSAPAVTWVGMLQANTGDAIQSRRPDLIFYHGFAYGNLTVPPAPIYPNGNPAFIIDTVPGTQMAYQFGCGNFFSNTSAQFTRVNSSLAVVGSANSMQNAAFIRGVQLGAYNYTDLNDPENCRIEPSISMNFLQAQVGVGEVAQMKVTISNPYHTLNGFILNLEGISLANNLPSGITLSGANPVSNTCGGTFSGAPGASNYSLSGFNLASVNPPGPASCEFIVSVIPSSAGSITNTINAGQVTSLISGVSGGANLQPSSAKLVVVNTNVVKQLPGTGFAPGRKTTLPAQTSDKVFLSLSDLWLEIPRLGVKAEIKGIPLTKDGWDVSWLMDQIGWLGGTAFPTWAGNSVLTAHVYNAQGQPGPFVDIHTLKWGDQLIIHAWGQKYIYEVQKVRTGIKPDDVSVLGHKDYPYLTLITCHGYDEKGGSYKWRTVVQAVQVKIY